MKAARLYAYREPLRLEDLPVPQPQADEVLVRVAGAGVCHSDLYVIDGLLSEYVTLPVTMGHEIAGWVEQTGPRAAGLSWRGAGRRDGRLGLRLLRMVHNRP